MKLVRRGISEISLVLEASRRVGRSKVRILHTVLVA
jgi:hypothetical protein